MNSISPARLLVVRSLIEIDKGGSAEDLLREEQNKEHVLSSVEKKFSHFLLFGVLRERGRLDELLNRNSKKTIDKQKSVIRAILRLAAFEMKCSRVPIHAVIDQAVRLTHKFSFRFASGFVNALLRKTVAEELSTDMHLNLPKWMDRF